MPSLLETRLAEFRAALLRRDEATLRALAGAWERTVVVPLEAEARLLAAQMARDGLLAGGTAPDAARGRLARLERFRALLAQADEELARLLPGVERAIRAEQLALVRFGGASAEALTAAALGEASPVVAGFNRLPSAALTDLIGATRDGTPLRAVLAGYGEAAGGALTDELVAGMARGDGPDAVARRLRDRLVALGGGTDAAGVPRLGRLQGLARDSILDAYRRSTLATYAENADLLDGWAWMASLSERTCAACLSLHRTEHPLSEQFFPRHNRCRCAAAPLLKGEGAPPGESGEEWLARQDAATQARVLGKAGAADYRAGKLRLADWVREDDSPVWGRSFRQDSLAGARRRAAGRANARRAKAPLPKAGRATTIRDARATSKALGVRIDKARADDLDVVNGINEASERMRDAGFPLPDRWVVDHGDYDWTFGGSSRDPLNQAMAVFDPRWKTVYVNRSHPYWTDPGRYQRAMADQAWQSSGDPLHVFYHEGAHALHYRLSPHIFTEGGLDWESWRRADAVAVATDGVSRYAATDKAEFVAEVFAGRMAGREFSPEVLTLYEQLGGGDLAFVGL